MAKSFDREIQRILREEVLLEDSLNPPRTAALVKSERSIRKVLNQWLLQSGLDTKALEALEADHQRERRRGNEKLKRLASRQGAARHKEVVKQAKALREMAGFGPVPGGVQLVVLDQPRRIVASPNPGVLTDSRISPGDNFAKILINRTNRGRDRVNFVFTFQNISALPVTVNASATLSATGLLDLRVNDGWLGNVGYIDVSSTMSVRRRLTVHGAATSGPTLFKSVMASNYPWWPSNDGGGPASAAVDHVVRGVPLAGNATVTISVSMTVFSDFDDGRGISDFDFGLFGISVPQVTLTVTPASFVFVAQG